MDSDVVVVQSSGGLTAEQLARIEHNCLQGVFAYIETIVHSRGQI